MIINDFILAKLKKNDSDAQNQNLERLALVFITKKYFPIILKMFMFNNRFDGGAVDITCNCRNLDKGRCNKGKTVSFILNFISDKTKIVDLPEVPGGIQIKKIKDYLDDFKSMLFFIFATLVLMCIVH